MLDTYENVSRPTILVVDDTPDNLSLLSNLLRELYRVKIATSGAKALQIAQALPQPDLILLDVMMPDMDGYETCRLLKRDARTVEIPVIFLTAKNQVHDEELGLRLGAVDYISKPVSPPVMIARVATQLRLLKAQQQLRAQNHQLKLLVAEKTQKLNQLQQAIVLGLASLSESGDAAKLNHLRRTQEYLRVLAQRLCRHPDFANLLNDETIDLMVQAAPLHDIGRIQLPDWLSEKRGKWGEAELALMRQHAVLGREAIEIMEHCFGGPHDFLRFAREIAYSHQEKWDGSGYPQQLAGEAIPVSARMMCVADVYDALISEREYESARRHADALEIVRAGSGVHFDPRIVHAFCEVSDEICQITQRFPVQAVPAQMQMVL
ncbi:response regulator [Undibacterium sp. CY7W]|uniref:Response regulator n=1 Tax=Undibacterium rugosum TaxID=2762291 RepID=A0A923IBI5_9BURK|nr:HD domain-containing phosphohydrolase [Undibacterium rugosum]MBC3936225.1 response regulator [Undibacterium rugosum]